MQQQITQLLQRYRTLIIAAVAVVVFGVIVWAIVNSIMNIGKTATLDIQSAVPTDIKVTVDGNGVTNNGKVNVTPGQHTLVAQRNGFESQTQKFSVIKGETRIVRLLLVPNSQEGYDWARNHPDQYSELESKTSRNYDSTSQTITNKYPIISLLPEVHATWRIDYGESPQHPNDPNYVALTITYGGSDVDKQNALSWISQQGFNPNDYEIIYKTPPAPGG